VGQVAALAAVFGVEPSYLVDRKEPPPLDAELLEGLRDETAGAILRKSARLQGIVRQFEFQPGALDCEEPSM
jgi:hypothetical protein